tara:strand:+ start:1564 stop:2481 length:918 start_codon:yes stop_codon:yes gene_type:complete
MRQLIPSGFNLTSKIFEINNEFFVMIPKNASNTILYGTSFSANYKNFNQIEKKHKVANVFIRDPISRFKAGLVESIKRCSPFIVDNYVASRASVPTSNDINFIYTNILDQLHKDSKKFISDILDILSCSFYDPHLCPQWYFFTSLECKTILKIKMFLLDDLENVMSSLNLRIDRSYNINSSFDTEQFTIQKYNSPKKILKKAFKTKSKIIDKILTNVMFKLNSNSLYSQKSLEPVYNFISYQEWNQAKEIIYKTINKEEELKSYIRSLYKIDCDIYNNLKRNKLLILPKGFNLQLINEEINPLIN